MSKDRLVSRLGLPLARQPLRLRDLGGRHLRGDQVAVPDGNVLLVSSAEARRRQAKPHVCLHIVLRHSQATVIEDAEVELSAG